MTTLKIIRKYLSYLHNIATSPIHVLGSGDFVSSIMKDANDSMDHKVATACFRWTILISKVCSSFKVTLAELVSKTEEERDKPGKGCVMLFGGGRVGL